MVEYSNPDHPVPIQQEVERVPLQPSEQPLLDGDRGPDASAPSRAAVAERTTVSGMPSRPLPGVSGGLALPTEEASRAETPGKNDVRQYNRPEPGAPDPM